MDTREADYREMIDSPKATARELRRKLASERARRERLEAALREYVTNCEKCDGEGWVWGHELDEYDVKEAPTPDDTRYSCDRCRHARKALEDQE